MSSNSDTDAVPVKRTRKRRTKIIDTEVSGVAPSELMDVDDVGDCTQRNFRYQHAYGVILLIGAALKRLPYSAIWCEHHEDILAEREDGKWDGIQVKTRKPELGEWDLNDSELCSAIAHLARLEAKFSGQISALQVVSNASFLDTDNEQTTHKSLPKLLKVTRLASTPDSIAAPHGNAFNKLAAETGHCHDTLFSALRKMEAVCGPGRDSFDAEISHNHVANLPGCENLSRARLNTIRDELVARVYRASSLSSDDPSRHWCCVSGEHHNHPQLAAKRISVQDVLLAATERQSVPFRYLQGSGKLTPGSGTEKLSVLECKLLAAGLQSQLDVFTTRMLSAESRLLEKAELAPERIQPLLDQLENVVKAEYAEALLVVEQDRPPYGNRLLVDLYGRLRAVAEHRSSMVEGEPYETLAGIAAMLTAECLLWWGPRFEIGGNQ